MHHWQTFVDRHVNCICKNERKYIHLYRSVCVYVNLRDFIPWDDFGKYPQISFDNNVTGTCAPRGRKSKINFAFRVVTNSAFGYSHKKMLWNTISWTINHNKDKIMLHSLKILMAYNGPWSHTTQRCISKTLFGGLLNFCRRLDAKLIII